jgi:hypothetical protein
MVSDEGTNDCGRWLRVDLGVEVDFAEVVFVELEVVLVVAGPLW